MPVKRLTKVFAFNVNLFWVRECRDELALLHERVLPGGAVYLFYEAKQPELVPTIVKKASASLTQAGFRVSVVEQKAPRRRHRRADGLAAGTATADGHRRVGTIIGCRGPRVLSGRGRRRRGSRAG